MIVKLYFLNCLFLFLFHFQIVPVTSDLAVCTDGFNLINGKCLKLFTNSVNHATAERTCMDYGATLVTVKNNNDNRAIFSIAGISVSMLWMGLYCLGDQSTNCLWDDYSGSADMYSNFADGFPLVEVGKCVYFSTQGALAGRWLSGNCESELKPFVCELPVTNQDPCQYNYNGYCYTFSSSVASFDDAQASCQQSCGNLASIHSAMENRYISTRLAHIESGDVLIGANWPLANVFSWIDGSLWNYSAFDPSFSKYGDCFAISNGIYQNVPYGDWYSVDCERQKRFLCKRPSGVQCIPTPPPVIVTPRPSNPSNCNASLLLAPGVITSPNYPNYYDNLEYCEYQLTTIGSYVVLLKFTDFDTEYGDDWVKVYDGESTGGKLLGAFSGDKANVVISSGNTMLVTFRSDKFIVASGFRATFSPYAYGR